MRMRALLPAAALSLLGLTAAWAVDPPHWSGTGAVTDCSSCHTGHAAPGGTLNTASGDVNLCQSCHNASGAASALPMDNADKAQPGISGVHHAFDVPAVNAAAGATTPSDTEMAARVMVGNVVCSTCHNAHSAVSANRGTPRISPASKLAGPGSGTLTSGGTYSGTAGAWYLVEIDAQGSQATATFRWSRDGGTSWLGTGVPCGNGAPVALNFGATVTFLGGANTLRVGDQWEFYASWPFLRVPLDEGADQFCRDCHGDFVMDHTAVRTYDGTYKSHPVGVNLGVNGLGYDRAVPLDGNGTPQGGGGNDAVASNNLRLDGTGRVQCFTCHGVHYADSNTATEDGP